MPRQAVEKQLNEEIDKFNGAPNNKGHLVMDVWFIPPPCKANLGKSEEVQGNAFRKHLMDSKVVPICSEGIINPTTKKQQTLWLHPNRREEEKAQSKKGKSTRTYAVNTNCFAYLIPLIAQRTVEWQPNRVMSGA